MGTRQSKQLSQSQYDQQIQYRMSQTNAQLKLNSQQFSPGGSPRHSAENLTKLVPQQQ